MPHVIIEHSSDFSKKSIKAIQVEIQNIMKSITEGNFDPDQCKCRAISFDEYLVGHPNQDSASFIHVSIKILSGRTIEARKKLSNQSLQFIEQLTKDLKLTNSRCDLSVDIIEMDKETYQKTRITS